MTVNRSDKKRTPIPEDVSAQILFESDRICCVCRNPGRKVEIHHIDTNPSNNSVENLAVLCKDCHSDAHTSYAFARSLGPSIIKKYNETWREIIRLRLHPGGKAGEELEYSHQVLLHLHLAPYSWRNAYIDLYPGNFNEIGIEVHLNPWNSILAAAKHTYSEKSWQHYLPLFKTRIPKLVAELENIVRTYGDALPPSVKLQVARCCHSLHGESLAYFHTPEIIKEHPEHQDLFMYRRFVDTLSSLQRVSELANAKMMEIKPPPSPDSGTTFAALQ